MALQIITADQRLAEKKGHKIVVCGSSGVGKTTLARTLNPATTLFMDLEAGDAAIEGHPIDVVRPRTWVSAVTLLASWEVPTPLFQKISHTDKLTTIM
jgi:ABC-type transport system involved in cytochrome bd biosynthesis fused ATPase/permease subunit